MRCTTIAPKQLTYVATGDETPAKGSVCDDLDSKLPRSLQDSNRLILDVQGEGGIFNLDGRDWVDQVCPAKGRSRNLREPDVFDLPGPTIDKGSDP